MLLLRRKTAVQSFQRDLWIRYSSSLLEIAKMNIRLERSRIGVAGGDKSSWLLEIPVK